MFSMVHNIDCMLGMREYPDQYFDLAVCDPNYGINVGKMNFVKRGQKTVMQKNGSRLRLPQKRYHESEFDNEAPGQSYFDELRRVSKHQIVFGINYFNWEGVGQGRIEWDKCVADGVGFTRFEYAYCSLIQEQITIKLLHSGMMQAKSLKTPTRAHGDKSKNEKRIHPCQKPKLLYQWIYGQFAQPGDKIIDTHVGSGSSRIVAEKMGFPFTGFEIDPIFFDAQEVRFLEETSMPLFSRK